MKVGKQSSTRLTRGVREREGEHSRPVLEWLHGICDRGLLRSMAMLSSQLGGGMAHPRRGHVSAARTKLGTQVATNVSKQRRLVCRATAEASDGRIGARWEELVLELREWKADGKVCATITDSKGFARERVG